MWGCSSWTCLGSSSGQLRAEVKSTSYRYCEVNWFHHHVPRPFKRRFAQCAPAKRIRSNWIRWNNKPPDMYFTRTKGGGLKFNSLVNQPSGFDCDQCHSALEQYKIYNYNADVVVREEVTLDDFIDVTDSNREYLKCIHMFNKIDMLDEARSTNSLDGLILRSFPCTTNWILIFSWRRFGMRWRLCVCTTEKGMFPDFTEPLVLTPQCGNKTITVENAVLCLHN